MHTTRWLGRVILSAATAILLLIAIHFLFDTTAEAAARGIAFTTPLGETIARVGLGAFPLAAAIVTAASLSSVDRVRRGLWFIVILFGTVLLVRVVSASTNGSMAASVRLVIPEVIFVALSAITLVATRSSHRPLLPAVPARTPRAPRQR